MRILKKGIRKGKESNRKREGEGKGGEEIPAEKDGGGGRNGNW